MSLFRPPTRAERAEPIKLRAWPPSSPPSLVTSDQPNQLHQTNQLPSPPPLSIPMPMSVPTVGELIVFVYCVVLTYRFPKLLPPPPPPDPELDIENDQQSIIPARPPSPDQLPLVDRRPSRSSNGRVGVTRNFAAAVKEGDNLPPAQQPHPDTGLLVHADHNDDTAFDAEKDKVNSKSRAQKGRRGSCVAGDGWSADQFGLVTPTRLSSN